MALTKAAFDKIPTITDSATLEAWQECVLSMVGEFSLTATQYEDIEKRYETIGRIFDDPTDARLRGTTFFTQGSFLSRTVIKPPSGGEIDVDAIVWTPNASRMTASELYDAVFAELGAAVQTDRGVEKKNRCSRVLYADESPTFHLDVTPAINVFGNEGVDGVGRLFVPDCKAIEAGEEGWKPSAPKAFAEWLDKRSKQRILLRETHDSVALGKAEARVEPLPSKQQLDQFDPLRACIKLLKFHRERFFASRSDKDMRPISVLLTTLAAKAYERIAQQSFGHRLTAIEAIIAIIDELPNGFDQVPPQGKYQLANPVFQTENFAERWNDPGDGYKRVRAFKVWHEQIAIDIRLGQKAFDSKDAFVTEAAAAFGARGAKTMLERYLDEKAIENAPMPGLSEAAISSLQQGGALNRAFGIKSSKPKQDPEPLGQLG